MILQTLMSCSTAELFALFSISLPNEKPDENRIGRFGNLLTEYDLQKNFSTLF